MNWIDKFNAWRDQGKPNLVADVKTIEDAIDPQTLKAWLSQHKNQVVGIGHIADSCVVVNYLKDVLGLYWVTVAPFSIVYVNKQSDRELERMINPYWLTSFITNLDGETSRGEQIKGSRALAVLNQVIKRQGV